MKRLTTAFIALVCSTGLLWGQATLKGKVVSATSDEPLIGASVLLAGSNKGTVTDVDGMFSLKDVPSGAQTLEISYLGYQTRTIQVDVPSSGMVDLGTIELEEGGVGLKEVVVTGVMDIVRDRRTPVAVSTITAQEIQLKSVGNVEFPEVMKNTPSVYVSHQTGFGDSRMYLRGFDQVNTAFLLNGQPINGMEDGKMYWSNWAGMSDIATLVQVQRGLGSSKLAISSVGGTVNIVTKTIENKKGGFVRFMLGNDNYIKGTVAYNTGLINNKWAVSFLLDHWQGDRKWPDGTWGSGQNYFFSVGYKPAANHSVNFLITGAPQYHGQRWSQKESTIRENPRFNQHWGYDYVDGDSILMTERLNFYHKPIINLSWDWDIDEISKLSSVLYASFGRGGGTGPYGRKRVRTADGQVDFAAIRKNNEQDSDGIGKYRENYALRASMNNHQWYGNVTNYERQLNDNISLSLGWDFRWYTGDHFRQLVNLLGLQGWNDAYRHHSRPSDYVVTATFDPNPWTTVFKYAKPEERIAYDYSETINYQGVFGQVEYVQGPFTTFVQGALSNQTYQRQGRWTSNEKSKKVNRPGFNIKTGASYTVMDNHTVFFNTGYYSRQPFSDNIYKDVRYSNEHLPTVANEEILGFEAGYKFRMGSFLRANLNFYSTRWGNRTYIRIFTNDNGTPDDESDDFTQRNVETGIGQHHKGVEFDIALKTDMLTWRAYTSIGDWRYLKIRKVTAYNDDTGEVIAEDEGADLTNVHVPNAPQQQFGSSIRIEPIQNLMFDLDFNYYAKIYRRDGASSRDIIIREDLGVLDPYYMIDAGLGYKMQFGQYPITFRLNVYNVENKQTVIVQTDPYGVINHNGLTWNAFVRVDF